MWINRFVKLANYIDYLPRFSGEGACLKTGAKKKRKKNQLQNDKTFIKNMMLLHLCTKKKLLLELNIIMHKKQTIALIFIVQVLIIKTWNNLMFIDRTSCDTTDATTDKDVYYQ